MWCFSLAVAVAAGPTDGFDELVRPFVQQHCFECHSGEEARSALDLASFESRAEVLDAAFEWESVRDVLVTGEMPPADRPRPDVESTERVQQWIEEALDLEPRLPSAALAPLRRLNRTEYQNTIRDFLGYDFRADQKFPRDEVSSGFDNVADSLAMPAVLFEKYLFAAEEIARQVISVADYDDPPSVKAEGEELRGPKYRVYDGFRAMHTSGIVSMRERLEEPGIYRVVIEASAQQAGPAKARMDLRINGKKLESFELQDEYPEVEVFEHEVTLEAGRTDIAAAFINDYYRPDDPDPGNRDRNLLVRSITLIGPVGASKQTRFQYDFEAQYPKVRSAVEELAKRAFRRPPTKKEVDRLLALSPLSAKWAARVRPALIALLASPNFLFKVELDRGEPGQRAPLSDWELATRLSYFLWASMPDAELFEHCEAGDLSEPEVLRAQVARMLRDPRASSLSDDFAAQWLKFRNLEEASPDRRRFTTWTDSLRDAMREETRLFFETVMREDRPVAELIDADYTFLNEELAKHYGIPSVRGSHMRRVRIPDETRDRRGGILGHAGLLTITSNPTRTSPVLRGKWIMETILGTPPPAPPPGVDDLPAKTSDGEDASLRERLEEHRANPNCAVCHTKMDALGLGLEHYDAIGRWRRKDGRFEIDASTELPDGTPLEGAAGLRDYLTQDRSLLGTLARALTTYALGRSLDRGDRAVIDGWVTALHNEATMKDVIERIVSMEAFKTRIAGVER